MTIDGKVVAIHDMTPGPDPLTGNFAFSNVGIYIDTLGRTKPIEWVDGFVPSDDNDAVPKKWVEDKIAAGQVAYTKAESDAKY